MSKGAVSISPVDNTKDELYAILRKRLFKDIKITDKGKGRYRLTPTSQNSRPQKVDWSSARYTQRFREELEVLICFIFPRTSY